MAENVGSRTAEIASEYVRDVNEFVYNVLMYLLKKQKYEENPERKTVEEFLNHMKNGGSIKNIAIPAEDTQLMAECLKHYKIDYLNIENPEMASQEGKTVFLAQDKDISKLEKALDLYKTQKGMGSYIKENDLYDKYKGKEISVFSGLNVVEQEVFKEMAKKEMLEYSIKTNRETGDKEILVADSNKDIADTLIKRAIYETSGNKGRELTNEVEKFLESENEFKEATNVSRKNDVVYVVDMDNPAKFISIQKDQKMIHVIGTNEQNELYDKKIKVKNDASDNFLKYVSSMHKPVVLSEKEMLIVNSIDSKGDIIIPEKEIFDNNYNKLKEELKDREDYYRIGFKIDKELDNTHIYQYTNLSIEQSQAIYQTIKRNNLENNAILYGNELAYTEEAREQLENAINENLYGNMENLETKQVEMFYQGRGVVDLITPLENNQYIIDADYPKNIICITKNGFTLFENGSQSMQFRKDNDKHNDYLLKSINAMKNPVCLSEDEMKKENINQVLYDRNPSNRKNLAYEILIQKINQDRAIDIEEMMKKEQLNEREQETIDKYESRIEIHNEYIDAAEVLNKQIDNSIRDDYYQSEDRSR